MKNHTIFYIILLSLFSSSCTTLQNNPSHELQRAEKQKNPAQLTQWQLSGAIAAKQNKKAWSASLTWEQSGLNHYRLSLFGPMGGNAIMIERNQDTVTYQEGEKTEHAHDIDTLIYQKTGQKLPLSHLYYWVRGLKSPGKATAYRDASGHLVQLKQAGYTLSYSQYQTIDGYDLPLRIQIEHANGWLKLIIKAWVPHA